MPALCNEPPDVLRGQSFFHGSVGCCWKTLIMSKVSGDTLRECITGRHLPNMAFRDAGD